MLDLEAKSKPTAGRIIRDQRNVGSVSGNIEPCRNDRVAAGTGDHDDFVEAKVREIDATVRDPIELLLQSGARVRGIASRRPVAHATMACHTPPHPLERIEQMGQVGRGVGVKKTR